MSERKVKPGDIIDLGGTQFAVLDDDYEGKGNLFILALEIQGEVQFGENNNYNKSALRTALGNWYTDFVRQSGIPTEKLDLVKYRSCDLTTLDGRGHYESVCAKAAPLTLDEARKYADVIPQCDSPWWLATGWGNAKSASRLALIAGHDGDFYGGSYTESRGIRPALVIDPALLECENNAPVQDESTPLDLSKYSTNELCAIVGDILAEVRRRTGLDR